MDNDAEEELKIAMQWLPYVWKELNGNQYSLSNSGEESICLFLQTLTSDEIEDAMNIAKERIPNNQIEDRFKYFCGVCWNKIKIKKFIRQPFNIKNKEA